jgi:hypothetical protein
MKHSGNEYLKQERLKLLEKRLLLQRELPHLYGQKKYPWQRKFFDSINPMNLLTAANQIGKSSINIIKCIDWCTNKEKWKDLWKLKIKTAEDVPGQIWYLYPDLKVATVEYHEKWVKEFLPKGSMKDDPVYGWHPKFNSSKQIEEIRFNTGVTIYFKTYSQNAQSLQSGTVYAIFCDEELPFNLFDELRMRLSAVDGYFHLVFTATLNQDEWRRAMEPEDGEEVMFVDAFKQQISLYACRFYEDGTPSDWTEERIQSKIDGCSSQTEVNRRIHGKFVTELNRKYQFEPILNSISKEQSKITKEWNIYSGVDIGSGGKEGHPPAIVFVAVSPDYTQGEVFLGLRMDQDFTTKNTTAGDILEQYLKMKEGYETRIIEQRYDFAARDFKTLADRISEPFLPANKKHDEGEEILNTLFRYLALSIHNDAHDLFKLCTELRTLKKDTDKRMAKDDYADALRYACVGIPWDLEKIKVKKFEKPKPEPTEFDFRRGLEVDQRAKFDDDVMSEISHWNELYDP